MLRHILHLPENAFAAERDDTTDAVALAVYGAVSSTKLNTIIIQ